MSNEHGNGRKDGSDKTNEEKHINHSRAQPCTHCTQSIEAIASDVTRIVHDICAAMNERHFDTSIYPWTHVSEEFTAEPGVLFVDDRLNRTEWIDRLVQITSIPSWRGEIKSLEVRVNKLKTRVDVFVCFEFYGIPEGIVRPAVGTIEFRAVNGTWLFTRFSTASGLSGAEVGLEQAVHV